MVTTKQRSAERSTGEESTKKHNAIPEADDERNQGSGNEAEMQELIERQIAQAIEPVLADFREQMTQAVQQEMEHAFSSNDADSPGGDRRSDRSDDESQAVEARAPSAQEEERSSEGDDDRQQESRSQSQTSDGGSLPGKLTRRLQPIPSTLVQGLEHKVEDWLQDLVVAGLTTALSEASRAAIQKSAEKGLDALLERTFDALPDNSSKRELQTQTKRTLHAILREVLDAVYAEEVRKELQSHGEQTTRSLIHRDMDGALDSVNHAVQTIVREVVSVLQRQWQKVLRLLFKLVMMALDSSLPSDEQESLPDSSEKQGEKEAAGKK